MTPEAFEKFCADTPASIRGIAADWATLPEDLREQYMEDAEWVTRLGAQALSQVDGAERERLGKLLAEIRDAIEVMRKAADAMDTAPA